MTKTRRNRFTGLLTAALALGLLGLGIAPSFAATLYIGEYANGVTPVGSSQPQVPPQPVITDQTVALSASSAASAAFNAKTHVVSLICDQGCSVSFTGTSPTATTSNLLLQQGVTYLFGVAPGGKVAAISNTAGNAGGAISGTVTTNQGTSPWIVAGSGTAGTSATGVVTVQGIAGGTAIPITGTISTTPLAFTSITASATGTTGATTATLAAAAAKTTYICGFTITSDATAALAGAATVTGTITGTLSYIQNVGSATAAGLLTQAFSPCIPASAVNTAIAVNSVAAGTGGNTAVVAWGYQQ